MEKLKNIKIGKYKFVYRVENRVILPKYKGSTIRGAFGYSLKKLVCVSRFDMSCIDCSLKHKCIYARTFESVNEKEKNEKKLFGKYPYIPHPFLIEVPDEKREVYKKDDKIEFNFILLGDYIEFLPYYIFAFKNVGEKGIGKTRKKGEGIAILEKVIAVYNGNEKEIYDYKDDKLKEDYKNYVITKELIEKEIKEKEDKDIKLIFKTPVRIKKDRKLTRDIDFEIFIKNLLRRITAVALYYWGEDFSIDAKEIIEKSKSIVIKEKDVYWMDWERFSTRQKQRMKLGGIKGKVVFSGEGIKDFLDIIKIGEYLHIGKGTAFGLGRYVVES